MPPASPALFRREAFEHLSSPERLDQLVVVVRPREWIMLTAAAIVVITALAWGIWGSIPIAVSGNGNLAPDQKRSGAGFVAALHFRAGNAGGIRPGMAIRITPDVVEREPFNALAGRVRDVSFDGGPTMQVTADLNVDPAKLRDVHISAGMPVVGRVILEERRPISYVLPFGRSRRGGD